jgi:hypothetical protein
MNGSQGTTTGASRNARGIAELPSIPPNRNKAGILRVQTAKLHEQRHEQRHAAEPSPFYRCYRKRSCAHI